MISTLLDYYVVVEVAPAYDVAEITALAGASMICFYMGLLVERGVGLASSSGSSHTE